MQHCFLLIVSEIDAISGVRDGHRNRKLQKSLRFRCAKGETVVQNVKRDSNMFWINRVSGQNFAHFFAQVFAEFRPEFRPLIKICRHNFALGNVRRKTFFNVF